MKLEGNEKGENRTHLATDLRFNANLFWFKYVYEKWKFANLKKIKSNRKNIVLVNKKVYQSADTAKLTSLIF